MEKGERIRSRREALGMTQTELADALSTTKQNIYKYENGIISNIPSDKIEAMAEILKTTPAYLMGWEEETVLPPNIEPLGSMQKIPLVGQIACGTPILAEQNIEDYVDLPGHIRSDFALTCKGESMIGAGIRTGDIVYIRKQEEVESGHSRT